jgi:hypothetical protein
MDWELRRSCMELELSEVDVGVEEEGERRRWVS